jgi:hypothetical protein
MNPKKKGSTMSANAKSNAKTNVDKLLDEAEALQTSTVEEPTVPAQTERGEKVTAERGEDGRLSITVSDAEDEEPSRLKKLLGKLKENKKGLIAGGVFAAAILLGVSVQKKRTTTEPQADEPEATEPSEG